MIRVIHFIKKAIKVFRQERVEGRLYWKSLSLKQKQALKKERRVYFASLGISLALHLFLGLSAYNRLLDSSELLGDVKVKGEEIDFEITSGMVSSHVQPVYDTQSDVVIDPTRLVILLQKKAKKQHDQKSQDLNNLLKQLRPKGLALSAGQAQKPNKKSKLNLQNMEQSLRKSLKVQDLLTPKRVKPLNVAGLLKQGGLGDSSSKAVKGHWTGTQIMKVIDQHSFRFRDCYEKALLKDESLSVKAVFLLRLNKSRVQNTSLKLSGQGRPDSRKDLSHCLFRESRALVFAGNKQSISIRFNLIFGL